MDVKGYEYAADMTNQLAFEVSEEHWNRKLNSELDTLRKLFIHMVRVRDVYQRGIHTGVIEFPGTLPPDGSDLRGELIRSKKELAGAFIPAAWPVRFFEEELSLHEVMAMAIQHEGIHQGQYFVALKQHGIELPRKWKKDWGM